MGFTSIIKHLTQIAHHITFPAILGSNLVLNLIQKIYKVGTSGAT